MVLIPYNILGHIRKDLEEFMNSYQCHQCMRTYKHKNTLARHLRYECQQYPSFACPYCPYASKRKADLQTHIHRRHPSSLFGEM